MPGRLALRRDGEAALVLPLAAMDPVWRVEVASLPLPVRFYRVHSEAGRLRVFARYADPGP